MSHFLDRLKFMSRIKSTFANGHGAVVNDDRKWENGYRSRWRSEPADPRYDPLVARLAEIEHLAVPTLVIQGASDSCVEPSSSAHQEHYFTGPYQRLVLEGIGHFPQRERHAEVASQIVDWLGRYR